MRLYVTVDGVPAVIVGYAPGTAKTGTLAIVIGLADRPVDVPLKDCKLPKLPRKLERQLKSWAKRETRETQSNIVGLVTG